MFEVRLVGREELDIVELQVLQASMLSTLVPVRTVKDLLVSVANCLCIGQNLINDRVSGNVKQSVL